jgi:lipopolysaccharide biosynthesis protein
MKLLAYYLPQYHPTPENDEWWGKGFTEWTNVTKAKPLYPGHHQPKLPADLGFYDLRLPSVLEQQSELALQYGVDGFVFYHYWFGKGKVMLQRPLLQFLENKKAQCTFCMCWANESWKGTWHGAGNRMLIKQEYGGETDYREHFNYLLPFFKDERHLKIDNKPVFQIYIPQSIPDLPLLVKVFREEAAKNGLDGIYLMGVKIPAGWVPQQHGFDGAVFDNWPNLNRYLMKTPASAAMRLVVNNPFFRKLLKLPKLMLYSAVRKCLEDFPDYTHDWFPLAMPNWDNTPRTLTNGTIYIGDTPAAFQKHIFTLIQKAKQFPQQKQIVFIKSWNEWAEGNILEPDRKYGHAFLNAVQTALKEAQLR